MAKVSIIGTGHIGRTAAYLIAQQNISNVVLLDILSGIPQGSALDISQAGYLDKMDQKIQGTNDYSEIVDSDIVVVSAGSPRKPGMNRDELINVNGRILIDITSKIKELAPEAIVIMVTNPLDLIVLGTYYLLGENRFKVMGMSSLLDSARMAYYLARATRKPISSIETLVIGAHNDTMVPLVRFSRIEGKKIEEFLEPFQIEQIIKETKEGGATIVSFLKEGSAYFAPAASISRMVQAILTDSNETFPASIVLNGEYGIKDVSIGVPVRLGRDGIKGIIELKLNSEEKRAFNASAQSVKSKLNLLADVLRE